MTLPVWAEQNLRHCLCFRQRRRPVVCYLFFAWRKAVFSHELSAATGPIMFPAALPFCCLPAWLFLPLCAPWALPGVFPPGARPGAWRATRAPAWHTCPAGCQCAAGPPCVSLWRMGHPAISWAFTLSESCMASISSSSFSMAASRMRTPTSTRRSVLRVRKSPEAIYTLVSAPHPNTYTRSCSRRAPQCCALSHAP